MKIPVLPLILVALVAASIGRWTAPSTSDRPGATTPVVAPETPGEVARAPRPEQNDVAPPQPVAPLSAFIPPEAPAPDARGLGFDPTDFLAGLPQQLDQIADLARGGDAKALGELAEWVDYCRRAEHAVRMGTLGAQISNALVDGYKDASVQQYFKQVQASCVAWKSLHPWIIAEQASMDAANRLTYLQMKASTSDPFPSIGNSNALFGQSAR